MDEANIIQLSRVRVVADAEARAFSVTLSVPVLSDAAAEATLIGGLILIGEHRYACSCEYHELDSSDEDGETNDGIAAESDQDGPILIGHQWLEFALPMRDVEDAIGEFAVQLELPKGEGACELYDFSYQRKKRAKRKLRGLSNPDIRAILIASKTGLILYVDYREEIRLFGGFCGRDSGIGPAQRAKTTIWN